MSEKKSVLEVRGGGEGGGGHGEGEGENMKVGMRESCKIDLNS